MKIEEPEIDSIDPDDIDPTAEPADPRQLLAGPDDERCWVPDLKDHQYHGDLSAVSSSQLRRMLLSPANFRAYFGVPLKDTKAMRLGRYIHEAVLEQGLERFTSIPLALKRSWGHASSNRHKAAKAAWLAEREHLRVIADDELETTKRAVDAVMANADARALLGGQGFAELSGYYTDEQSGIACRIRPDYINVGLNAIIDLKSGTGGVTPRDFQRTLVDYNYHVQLAMYGAGYEAIDGEAPAFYAWIAVETTPPYEVAVYTADRQMMDIAREDYHACLMQLRACIDQNIWPSACPEMQTIGLPAWMIKGRQQ